MLCDSHIIIWNLANNMNKWNKKIIWCLVFSLKSKKIASNVFCFLFFMWFERFQFLTWESKTFEARFLDWVCFRIYRHICICIFILQIHIDKALLLMDDSFALSAKAGSKRWTFNDERPVACWKEVVSDVPKGANPNIEICLAPNLVCAEAKQTAGCGDNISAAGLILQVWSRKIAKTSTKKIQNISFGLQKAHWSKHTCWFDITGLIPQTKKTSQKILVPVLSKKADQNILTYSNWCCDLTKKMVIIIFCMIKSKVGLVILHKTWLHPKIFCENTHP